MNGVINLSGGLDSICYSAILQDRGYQLKALIYNYGQQASSETQIAKKICKKLRMNYELVDISFMKELYGSSNNLTNNTIRITDTSQNTIVPFRNAIFLSIAVAHAKSIGYDFVALGSHTDDTSHPDCSDYFLRNFEYCTKHTDNISILAPVLENLSKSDLINQGYKRLQDMIYETNSCYRNVNCGKCFSCYQRKEAFKSSMIQDKTNYG